MLVKPKLNAAGMKEKKVGLCFKNMRFPFKKTRGLKLLFGSGCICCKGAKDDEKVDKEKESDKCSKKLAPSSREEEVVVDVDSGGNDAAKRLISEKSAGSNPATLDGAPTQMQRVSTMGLGHQGPPQISRVLSVRNGIDGAQVAAGWPSWLTVVAGEAIKGWIPRKTESFEKLDKIGQGTYSSVYRARDLETGKIVALKKVRFVNMDPESVRFMAREILVLRRLDHPNIMKLEGLITSMGSRNLHLVFEYMEHDLAGLASLPTAKFTEPQIKCYMKQLLQGLEHCHNRGILHRDIKGSNLLIDNNGNLKIADFGLATFFRANQKQPLTSRVVTLWYRPPELLLGATDYGVSVDLWSSGCILAELFAGKPIMPGRTEVEQLHKIFKLCGSPAEEYWKTSKLPNGTIFKPQQPYRRRVAETFKDFPPSALALLESLLAFEPEFRGSTTSALQSEFFTTKPLPCDPSTLPKYPPSKEFDARVRNEETRRQRGTSAKGGGLESSTKGSKESRAVPGRAAEAESQAHTQKRKGQSNRKGHSPDEHSGSGYLIGPSRESQASAAQLSRYSNSVAARGCSQLDFSRDTSEHSQWQKHTRNSRYEAESSHHFLGRPDYSYRNKGQVPRKEIIASYGKKSRMHHSGPLLPNGGSVEEMLKEHEKQIQIAVRKARGDKN